MLDFGSDPTDTTLSTNDIVKFHSADFPAQSSSPNNLADWAFHHYGAAPDWRRLCISHHKLNPP